MGILNNVHILVTRPAQQAENLSNLITEQGGIPIRFPTLEINPVDDNDHVKTVLANLDKFQWVVFISVNAVNFALKANGGKIPQSMSVRFGAIGQATAQVLKDVGLSVELMPTNTFNSEALLALPQMQQVEKQSFLIVRGEGGREELAKTLRSRGAEVHYLNVYKRVMPKTDSSELNRLLSRNKLNAVTIASGEALQNLLAMVEHHHHNLLFAIPLIVISERVRQIAADLGFKQIAVAINASDTAILEAVMTSLKGGVEWPN